ncbi:MAG: hypothetical protein BXU00_02930 [Candidatus Nanoclepta minutus]|uniref:Uncharacterized protein n=1 Tax=Candidatus Nanoclepta minutus TaxID=1940235 RepID=A0A397WNN9_9ARCH|nr:MAG: hypothetical protein BXU00_02930 [Candidatus Nanoclepta minutus]
MKNQTTSLIIILVVISLIVFSIAILGKTKVLDISKNIENLNTIKFFDQFSEALLKSITYKIVEKSAFEVSEEGLDKYLWYNYPDCGYRPPKLDEVNNYLQDRIKSKLVQTEEFVKLANMLKLFYPLEIHYQFDNIIIEFPFDENDLNNGVLDEGFPIIIKNISIYIKTPFGEAKKIYDFSMYIKRIRFYYLYRKIRNWLNKDEYIKLIKSVEREKGYIYNCNYGYIVFITPNYLCSAKEKIICNGEKVKVIIKEIINKNEACVDQSLVEEINKKNQQIEQTCNHEYEEEICEPDKSTCRITYATSAISKDNRISLSTYRFAVGGSGGSSSGGGGGGGGTSPGSPCIDVAVLSCVNITREVQRMGEQCIAEYPAGPGLSGPPCPDGIKCSSEEQVKNILTYIAYELKKELNNLFDNYVECDVNLRIDDIECYQTTTNKNMGVCSCGIAGKADMRIIATYFIKCTDYKYYSFIKDSLKNLELDFQLGVKGITNCQSGDLPSLSNIECCDVYNTSNGLECCSGIDGNGNCIECKGSETIENINNNISVICLS